MTFTIGEGKAKHIGLAHFSFTLVAGDNRTTGKDGLIINKTTNIREQIQCYLYTLITSITGDDEITYEDLVITNLDELLNEHGDISRSEELNHRASGEHHGALPDAEDYAQADKESVP